MPENNQSPVLTDLGHRELVVLGRDDCMTLLSRAVVGRVGLTVDALPTILPVTFAVLDGDVVFRTGGGSKLDAAVDEQVVCFEADGYDPATREGWSVLVTGRARVVGGVEETARARGLGLEPWAPAPRENYVRIRTELVSGRRIRSVAGGNGIRMDAGSGFAVHPR